MTADTRIQERLRRAADPLSVDVEARLEGARHRASGRQRSRRIGAGMLAALIGAAAVAAIWSLGEGQDPQPAVPAPAGTILHVVTGREWLDSQLFALPVGHEPPGSVVPWPGGTTPLAAPSYTPDGSQVAFLIDTGERHGLGPLFDIAVQRGAGPVEILVRGVDIVAEPEMGPLGQVAFVRRAGRDFELVIVAPDGTVGDPVVTGLAMNALAWSPDGSTIAVNGPIYRPDGTMAGQPLVLMAPDGSDVRDVRLELDRYPSRGFVTFDWSADSSTLAYTTHAPDGRSDIYLIDADGTNVRVVEPEGSPEDASARYPIWAPEGDWLAFESDRDADPAVRAANAERDVQRGFGLYVMRSDGSEVQPLIPPADGDGPMLFDWLPSGAGPVDGSSTSAPPVVAEPAGSVLWANKGAPGPKGTGLPRVYVQRADGADEPVEVDDPPVFVAPDGSKIMWEEYRGNQVSDLVVGNPDRSSPVVVATLDFMYVVSLEWSRDGSRIAYTYSTDDGVELWVTDVGTGEGSVISTMPGMFGVTWAPDGSRLAVAVARAASGAPGVYTMASDGSDVRRVSELDCAEVAWSPDGDDIAVTGVAGTSSETRGLWILDVAGDDQGSEVLIEPGASYPTWSPDGAWLLYSAEDFSSNDEQPSALYLMRPDGSDDRMLVPDPGEGWPIPWVWLEAWPL